MSSCATNEVARGYSHPLYAASLGEFGKPHLLHRSGGWLLERSITNTEFTDASGCYPLFTCTDWSRLIEDIEELNSELVCVSFVADPFGDWSVQQFQNCFKDRFLPFKHHFVTDLSQSQENIVSKHHRYYASRALDVVKVERVKEPLQFLDEWIDLYASLIERHNLRGIKAFSSHAFETQLQVPGITLLRATHEGEAVGAHLWFLNGDVAQSHLLAVSPKGYELMASYALYWTALEIFRDEARWLNLGGGAGIGEDPGGLARFKKGWATETRTAYFCGRIINNDAYAQLVNSTEQSSTFFPAYRKGEFD